MRPCPVSPSCDILEVVGGVRCEGFEIGEVRFAAGDGAKAFRRHGSLAYRPSFPLPCPNGGGRGERFVPGIVPHALFEK